MVASPQFKVYSPDNEYIASCKYAEDAAALVSARGEGTVRFQHVWTLWKEGAEDFPAGESYDGAAMVMYQRLDEMKRKAYIKAYGEAPS